MKRLDPARQVVEALGGVRPLARELNLNPSTISRWMTAVEGKGTGGRIPQRHWRDLLRVAKARRIRLNLNILSGL